MLVRPMLVVSVTIIGGPIPSCVEYVTLCLYHVLMILVVCRCSTLESFSAASGVHVLCGREHRFVGKILVYWRCLI